MELDGNENTIGVDVFASPTRVNKASSDSTFPPRRPSSFLNRSSSFAIADSTFSVDSEYIPAAKKKTTLYGILMSSQFTVFTIVLVWGWMGILFYKYACSWTWHNALFYAMQAGLSIGFGQIRGPDNTGVYLFTIFYILIGCSIIIGSGGYFLSEMFVLENNNSLVDPKLIHVDAVSWQSEGGKITIYSFAQAFWHRLKFKVGWYSENRGQIKLVFILLLWLGVGSLYGMLYEKWDFTTSFFFAFTACSTAGLWAPPCKNLEKTYTSDCDVGTARSLLVSFYCLIGVPLYVFTMTKFAAIGILYARRVENKRRLKRPLTMAEFQYAANLLSDGQSQEDATLDMGEFILLELLKLGTVEGDHIKAIQAKFHQLDTEGDGELYLEQLRMLGAVVICKRTRRSLALRGHFPYIGVLDESVGENGEALDDNNGQGLDGGEPKRDDFMLAPKRATEVAKDKEWYMCLISWDV